MQFENASFEDPVAEDSVQVVPAAGRLPMQSPPRKRGAWAAAVTGVVSGAMNGAASAVSFAIGRALSPDRSRRVTRSMMATEAAPSALSRSSRRGRGLPRGMH